MSGPSEQRAEALRQRNIDEDEALVFAASSILREMSRKGVERAFRQVISNGYRYRLEGHRLQTAIDVTGPIVLVFVEPAPRELPNEAELRERFGLTRKEARVARLIADGFSNEDVAEGMSISSHTARHHTEKVLAKLGVRTRAHVRDVLLG